MHLRLEKVYKTHPRFLDETDRSFVNIFRWVWVAGTEAPFRFSICDVLAAKSLIASPTNESTSFLTFVLTLPIFQLATEARKRENCTMQKLRKTMKTKHSKRSFGSGSAVSSVVEHFPDTEGVRGSTPLPRTTFY